MEAQLNALDAERATLLAILEEQRGFLRHTVQNLNDEQATQRTTTSELTLGGLVKHVLRTERTWARFILEGTPAIDMDMDEHSEGFVMGDDETLASLLREYEAVARETEKVISELPDLEVEQPLPKAPWFPENARWSARHVLAHIIRETAQHCGHADIIRESLDGQKTMG